MDKYVEAHRVFAEYIIGTSSYEYARMVFCQMDNHVRLVLENILVAQCTVVAERVAQSCPTHGEDVAQRPRSRLVGPLEVFRAQAAFFGRFLYKFLIVVCNIE